ncbi:unnamed protein product [Mytilus edulis]|uniref:BPL/LPL catalytic domain-containing protein n=1 Tax=Mytilus edulis TaxID=6550 RepID=A0A8S3RQB0_MYTED|nr:unnamed protein product [Mytilus edulis]
MSFNYVLWINTNITCWPIHLQRGSAALVTLQITQGIFDSILADDNIYYSLNLLTSQSQNNTTISISHSVIGSPQASSSPKKSTPSPRLKPKHKLSTLLVNFQSIRNKVPDTQVLIDNADPDIIVGTETWLNSEIFSPEVLPNNYNVFRRDRDDSHGGVLLAIKSDLVCTPVHTRKDSELLTVKLHNSMTKSTIISAFIVRQTAHLKKKPETLSINCPKSD